MTPFNSNVYGTGYVNYSQARLENVQKHILHTQPFVNSTQGDIENFLGGLKSLSTGISSSVLDEGDYITSENIVSDPKTNNKVSSINHLNLYTSTTFKDIIHYLNNQSSNTGYIRNVHKTVTSAPADRVFSNVSLTDGKTVANVDPKLGNLASSSLKFGFEPLTEVMKNCCSCLVILHSFLRSILLVLSGRIDTWASSKLHSGTSKGQEIAFYNALSICAKVKTLIETARVATEMSIGTTGPTNEREGSGQGKTKGCVCGKKTCAANALVGTMARDVKTHDENIGNAFPVARERRSRVPPEFVTRPGGGNTKRIIDDQSRDYVDPSISLALNTGSCRPTPPMDATGHIIQSTLNRVKHMSKKARIEKGMAFTLSSLKILTQENLSKGTDGVIITAGPGIEKGNDDTGQEVTGSLQCATTLQDKHVEGAADEEPGGCTHATVKQDLSDRVTDNDNGQNVSRAGDNSFTAEYNVQPHPGRYHRNGGGGVSNQAEPVSFPNYSPIVNPVSHVKGGTKQRVTTTEDSLQRTIDEKNGYTDPVPFVPTVQETGEVTNRYGYTLAGATGYFGDMDGDLSFLDEYATTGTGINTSGNSK